MQFFHLIFTEPGPRGFADPCTDSAGAQLQHVAGIPKGLRRELVAKKHAPSAVLPVSCLSVSLGTTHTEMTWTDLTRFLLALGHDTLFLLRQSDHGLSSP